MFILPLLKAFPIFQSQIYKDILIIIIIIIIIINNRKMDSYMNDVFLLMNIFILQDVHKAFRIFFTYLYIFFDILIKLFLTGFFFCLLAFLFLRKLLCNCSHKF